MLTLLVMKPGCTCWFSFNIWKRLPEWNGLSRHFHPRKCAKFEDIWYWDQIPRLEDMEWKIKDSDRELLVLMCWFWNWNRQDVPQTGVAWVGPDLVQWSPLNSNVKFARTYVSMIPNWVGQLWIGEPANSLGPSTRVPESPTYNAHLFVQISASEVGLHLFLRGHEFFCASLERWPNCSASKEREWIQDSLFKVGMRVVCESLFFVGDYDYWAG